MWKPGVSRSPLQQDRVRRKEAQDFLLWVVGLGASSTYSTRGLAGECDPARQVSLLPRWSWWPLSWVHLEAQCERTTPDIHYLLSLAWLQFTLQQNSQDIVAIAQGPSKSYWVF